MLHKKYDYTINFWIESEFDIKAEKCANFMKISKSELIRRAIKQFLKNIVLEE